MHGGELYTHITDMVTIDMVSRIRFVRRSHAHPSTQGPVFRSGPNELSFDSSRSLRDIYAASQEVIGKPDIWQCFSVDPSEPTILSTVDNEEHKFKHRTISEMFSLRRAAGNEERMRPHIDHFIDLLGAGEHDLQDLCNWLSLDIISDLLYGDSLSLLRSAEFRWVVSAYRNMSRWVMTVCILEETPVHAV